MPRIGRRGQRARALPASARHHGGATASSRRTARVPGSAGTFRPARALSLPAARRGPRPHPRRERLPPLFDLITRAVEASGYLGVALLMLAENLFPPIPSELIMPLAGFTAARGELNLAGVILAGSAGSLAGAWFWYRVGARLGLERLKRWAGRHGRWLTLTPEELDAADRWFDRHCAAAVLIGRLIPTVRTLISVPAGISGMAPGRFLLWSGLGTALWTGALATAGWALEDRHDRVAAWLNPLADLVLAGVVLGYLYRVATFRQRRTGTGGRTG